MRTCCKCKKKKYESEFNFKHKATNLLQKACKVCTRKEVRDHYLKNHEYYLLKARQRNAAIRVENKHFIWGYLSTHPCVDCGESDPVVLEFDHVEGVKRESIAVIIRTNTINVVRKEIQKCVIRCANCHRRRTAKQYKWHKLASVAQLDRAHRFER